MKEIYDWVPWFRELAKNIETGGETYLIEKAKEVDWGNNRSLLEFDDENIDPFSFFYFLAQRNTGGIRASVYKSVNEVFEISDMPPKTGWENTYIIPTPPGHATALFHDGENFNPTLLWKLFRQAVKDEPDIQALDFHAVLNIRMVGVAKLTQCLFLINPQRFIPIDKCFPGQQEIEQKIKGTDGWNICLGAIERTKQNFPGCHLYEIGRVYYLLWKPFIKLRHIFFQISTYAYGYGPEDGDDCWQDFEKNNWVYTGGPGGKDVTWENPSEGIYPLTAPKPGDIILVRTGIYKGSAIGIVEHNDYAEPGGLNSTSRIHVLWINKSEENISMNDFLPGLSDLGTNKYSKTYHAFRNTEGYKPTFDFIESRTKSAIQEGVEPYPARQQQEINTMENLHALNQILYGPPGTGKTWNTVNHAIAIIKNQSVDSLFQSEKREDTKERFDELKKVGRIEMVTFHQNYTYEDFIEGIKPVLAVDQDTVNGNHTVKNDIQYEMSSGVFKRIAENAKNDPEQNNYVLVIDEINRGNIAKIFGELITLLEESKRLGKDDEATVILPYSKEPFGVPNNLYIIGTMNTADRSIALLDTALRRRFDFVEMMPDPKHSDISEDINGIDCRKLLTAMNERITILYDREHQIGHTYLLDVKDLPSLEKTFKNKIIPLLQEYFYDNWEKIDLILNENGFITKETIGEKRKNNPSLLPDTEFVDDTVKIYELLSPIDEKWKKPGSYIKIYQSENQSSQNRQDTGAD